MHARCRLLAQSGHQTVVRQCLFLGVKRTSDFGQHQLKIIKMPRHGRTAMAKTKVSARDIVALSKKEGFLAK